ncbi:MAG: hypothetical protein KDD38_01090 [Bdellovibrionales bacterium]|nr:hypothetical protein [Bdellovibrionales bacterium]
MKKISRPGWPLNFLFAGAMAIPLSSGSDWKILAYRKIPANIVTFGESGMSVKVQKSASPIMYKLPETKKIQSIEVKGKLKGVIQFAGKQGEKKQDDFVLRVGVVVKGDKTLNFFQRSIAPKWILELHSLAPQGEGVDHIEFFNVVSDPALVGKSRKHPLSDLLYENFVWFSKGEGEFSFSTTLKKPLDGAAIWLSIDGDDTGAEYEIELTSLVLN